MLHKLINKLKTFIQTVKIILHADLYIIYTVSGNNILLKYTKETNKVEETLYVDIVNDIKMSLLLDKCNGDTMIYSLKLDMYDPDLSLAYKELNYLEAKYQYIEAEYMYYKNMNSTSTITAEGAYKLYLRVLDLKQQYLELESYV